MFNPSRPLCSLLPLRLEACSPHKHSLERLNLIFTTVSSLVKQTLKPSNTVANDFKNSVVKLGCWPLQSCSDTICPRLSNKRTAEYWGFICTKKKQKNRSWIEFNRIWERMFVSQPFLTNQDLVVKSPNLTFITCLPENSSRLYGRRPGCAARLSSPCGILGIDGDGCGSYVSTRCRSSVTQHGIVAH